VGRPRTPPQWTEGDDENDCRRAERDQGDERRHSRSPVLVEMPKESLVPADENKPGKRTP